MYKNRSEHGWNNISGQNIKRYREALPGRISQKKFSDLLLDEGLDLDKNAIQRIECGKRFVTDIELKGIARVLRVSYTALLDEKKELYP